MKLFLLPVAVLLLSSAVSSCPTCTQAPGGWIDVDVNRIDVQEVAQFVVSAFNKQSNFDYLKKLQEILEARTQLADSLKYFLHFQLVETDCLKTDVLPDLGNCNVIPNKPMTSCNCQVQKRDGLSGVEKFLLEKLECQQVA